MPDAADDLTPHLQPTDPGRGNVAVPLQTIMDPRMSAKALGLLTYALARQTIPWVTWRFYMSEIAANFSSGVEAVETGLRELEQLGYATRSQTPRVRGRFTGVRYEFHAVSPTAPDWPRQSGSGARAVPTVTRKAARGRAGLGESPPIQIEASAQPARGAGMESGAGSRPAALVAGRPDCSPAAGCATRNGDGPGRAQHSGAGVGLPAALQDDLHAILIRSDLDAGSDQGQALTAAVMAAVGSGDVAATERAVRSALKRGVRHPAAYLGRVLARTVAPPGVSAPVGPADLDTLRSRVLDRRLRIGGELTARVQDVLTGRWPALLLEDGRELPLATLGDYEVVE